MSFEVWILYKDDDIHRVENSREGAMRALDGLLQGDLIRSKYGVEGPFPVGEDHTRDAARFKEELRLSTATP